jgi:hypothetical protein
VRAIAITILSVASLFGIPHQVYGQECDNLRNAASTDLVSFLAGALPDEKNAECVAWAISQLGTRRYDPGAATLVRFLDFHRPLNANEKLGVYLRPQGIGDVYPAVDALALIGEKALPTVLHAIEADSTSTKARENAVFVWMEIYKYERPKGVALLKQELDKTREAAVKQQLQWALVKARDWCNPSDEDSCRRAAKTGLP